MRKYLPLLSLFLATPSLAFETSWKGLADVRASYSDGLQSYITGGRGKLQNSDGADLSLGQLGLVGTVDFNENWSVIGVFNGFADAEKERAGITELYLKYRSVPNQNGLRHGLRLGVFYPEISLENDATAWSTPNTLTPSTMNSWIGEEIRATGAEYTAEWLGKFRNKDYDFKLNGALFFNNDTAGALISWHGWTLSSRQTVLGESIKIPRLPAMSNVLSAQGRSSNIFHEEDDKLGYILGAKWNLQRKLLLQLGFYDNNATPNSVTNGQYGWRTRFSYGGFRWHIDKTWSLSGQILNGDTLMQSEERVNLVDNDYQSAYLSLGWKKGKHRINTRIEEFSVTDNDMTRGDSNGEHGQAVTLSHRYRIHRQWFLLSEYNWVNSTRKARIYENRPLKRIERQIQFGLRYYF